MFSDGNIEEIKAKFKSVISHSQEISDPKIDKLFERWYQAKEKFIKRFDGLIYEWPEPVEFTLDSKEKRKSVMEFIDCVQNTFNNNELAEFIDNNLDSFFDNVVINSGSKNAPTGMKLIKAFKFYEDNEVTLHYLQDMASQLIQANKVKGTLCFSVHPLDFLSSSCNTYNWRSCHALDGEFRAGNLSYMVDETTFMVYLKGENETQIPLFPPDVPWNSKKWRMLLYASPNDELMFAGRQYPFSSKSGIDTALYIYNNIIVKKETNYGFFPSTYGDWNNTYISAVNKTPLKSKYFVFGRNLFKLDDYIICGMGALNYNDLLNSSCYTEPYYAVLNPEIWHNEPPKIEIGKYVDCLMCEGNDISETDIMVCGDCAISYGFSDDNYTYCSCCDSRIWYEDAFYVNDDPVCHQCLNDYCFCCDECGEYEFNSQKHYIAPKQDGEKERWICHWCYNNRQIE